MGTAHVRIHQSRPYPARYGRGARGSLARGLALAALAAGCSTPSAIRPVGSVAPAATASFADALSKYDAYCREFESLSASGDLSVYDAGSGTTRQVGIRVVAGRGGRLYLKGSLAMITALEVTSDGDRFWFRLPTKNTVWTGSARLDAALEHADFGSGGDPAADPADVADGPEAGDEPYKALRPGDVTRALLPEPIAPNGDDALALLVSRDHRHVVLTLVDGRGPRRVSRRKVWLDRATLRIVRARSYDEHGDLTSEWRYDDWRDDGYPYAVTIWRPREGYRAAFALTRLRPNIPLPERAFTPRIPDGDELIEIDG